MRVNADIEIGAPVSVVFPPPVDGFVLPRWVPAYEKNSSSESPETTSTSRPRTSVAIE